MTNATHTCTDPYSYRCNIRILLPEINESTWNDGARAFLYLLGLLWCFLGVAIVSDVFMCSIERITSKTRIIRLSNPESKQGFKEVEVKVWNDTVANLTLMALGTSAPEILLSVIEIVANSFKSGELGPSTIVGSASFNLLIITGICILSIPNGQTKKVREIVVFAVTSAFNVFAYIWLAIVLIFITPKRVEIWEAVITFLLYPVLIIAAYFADKNFCRSKNRIGSPIEIGIGLSNKVNESSSETETESAIDIIEISREVGKHKELTEEEAARFVTAKVTSNRPHNSGWYRINATRAITGSQKLVPQVNKAFKDMLENLSKDRRPESRTSLSVTDLSDGGTKAVVEFTASSCSVMENEGKVLIGIKRYGLMDASVNARVETIDGTAEAESDYKPIKETVNFGPNETMKTVNVEIIDDDVWEPDEFFYLRLSIEPRENAVLGKVSINQVTIVNDDEPGNFEFSKPSYVVKESMEEARVMVQRVNGADGEVSVTWRTCGLTAVDGQHFCGGEGTLTFFHGETSKNIDIVIYDNKSESCDLSFQVQLSSPTEGCEIGKTGRTIVTIVTDEEFNGMVSRIANLTKQNLDSLTFNADTWSNQFRQAMNVNGGDILNATTTDYVMHFLTFFWKLIFAFIPPTFYAGGWLTFIASLVVIAILTAIISDFASNFGCLISLKNSITAVTLVAMGTSMPDTFASRQAALQEKWADSAIGNINGSNAVNVFLGLGLPWIIATIYWTTKGKNFEIDTESLGFNVIMYTILSCLTTVLFLLRRFLPVFGKGELGGPFVPKILSAIFVFLLWVFYIVLVSLQAENIIEIVI